MSLHHELLYKYDQHASTPVGLTASAKPKYVTPKVIFDTVVCTVVYGSYTTCSLLAIIISRSISSLV